MDDKKNHNAIKKAKFSRIDSAKQQMFTVLWKTSQITILA